MYAELPFDLRQPGPWDRWMTYEAIFTHAFAHHPLFIVCGYDRRTTPAPLVDDLALVAVDVVRALARPPRAIPEAGVLRELRAGPVGERFVVALCDDGGGYDDPLAGYVPPRQDQLATAGCGSRASSAQISSCCRRPRAHRPRLDLSPVSSTGRQPARGSAARDGQDA
jgi:hypothetical protein